jgi:hypothetical protein
MGKRRRRRRKRRRKAVKQCRVCSNMASDTLNIVYDHRRPSNRRARLQLLAGPHIHHVKRHP